MKVAEALGESSACISFDGKKLKQGLTKDSGDVDLLGFENGKSLKERKMEVEIIRQKIQQLDVSHFDRTLDLHELPSDASTKLKDCLLDILSTISLDALKVREIKTKKEHSLSKLIERGGENWRAGKFAFAVSATKAFL